MNYSQSLWKTDILTIRGIFRPYKTQVLIGINVAGWRLTKQWSSYTLKSQISWEFTFEGVCVWQIGNHPVDCGTCVQPQSCQTLLRNILGEFAHSLYPPPPKKKPIFSSTPHSTFFFNWNEKYLLPKFTTIFFPFVQSIYYLWCLKLRLSTASFPPKSKKLGPFICLCWNSQVVH